MSKYKKDNAYVLPRYYICSSHELVACKTKRLKLRKKKTNHTFVCHFKRSLNRNALQKDRYNTLEV